MNENFDFGKISTPSFRRETSLSLALPITSHYKVNNKTLVLFLESYKRGLNKIAFKYGKQFVETALFELPKHGYFKSGRHKQERQKSSMEVWQVTKILEAMLGDARPLPSRKSGKDNTDSISCDDKIDMDLEERNKEQEELRRLRSLISDIYETSPELMMKENNTFSSLNLKILQREREIPKDTETLWSEWRDICNEAAATRLCTSVSLSPADIADICKAARKGEKLDNDESLNRPLYPFAQIASNLLSLTDSPSVTLKVDNSQLSPVESSPIMKTPKNNPNTTIPVLSLSQCFLEDFQHLLCTGKVNIHHLNTYQGKHSPNGVNGCTVIAPLVVIYHLMENSSTPNTSIPNAKESDSDGNEYTQVPPPLSTAKSSFLNHSRRDGSLPDKLINDIIDIQAPTILPNVREKLGLSKDALIIPSDVHDYLMEQSFLSQDQFVGVCGGNILDEKHLDEFMDIFTDEKKNFEREKGSIEKALNVDLSISKPLDSDNKKAKGSNTYGMASAKSERNKRRGKMAATMFFHEHVVCILRCENHYEIIDSLPNITTLGCCVHIENMRRRGGVPSSVLIDGDHDHDPLHSRLFPSHDWKAAGVIPLDKYRYYVDHLEQEADARMAQMIMIQQQRVEEEKLRNMSLSDGIALLDNMDENVAVALAAAVSAEEAERAAATDTYLTSQVNAARIKCKDVESLKATLRWYSCSRFTDENKQYVDEYEWDDRNIEFDPRVFQAFIWKEAI